MDFDWREARGKSWRDRYPAQVVGGAQWRQAPNRPSLLIALEGLREKAALSRPTLFISHRNRPTDLRHALRVAAVARQQGFDVWLDVLDPALGSLRPGQPAYSWAVACIIEMALLNSTHLLAVMTPGTNGSQWVPYEFGRVKARLIVAANASSWLVGLDEDHVPEYLRLCPVHMNLTQVTSWLQGHATRLPSVTSWPSL